LSVRSKTRKWNCRRFHVCPRRCSGLSRRNCDFSEVAELISEDASTTNARAADGQRGLVGGSGDEFDSGGGRTAGDPALQA
jgi:hypothetical protein